MKKASCRLVALLVSLAMLLTMCPVSAFAAESQTMKIKAASVSGSPGSEVKLKIDISDNPGIASLKLIAEFGTDVELQSVVFNGELGGQSQQPQTMESPVTMNWFNGAANFTGENANFVTLTFRISESAEEGSVSPVTLSYNPDDIYNIDEENVDVEVTNGSITVLSCIPGDINGDESVNNKDLTRLFQYLANWEVSVNAAALDTNGDGNVNNKDLTRLFQYLAGWKVELHCSGTTSTQCNHVMEAVEFKASTCTEAGNIAYWYCTSCKKYFSNQSGTAEIKLSDTVIPATGHTVVVDSAVAPTYTETGLTEGSHCSVCNTVLVEQQVIPVLSQDYRNITYNVANGDSYLASQNIQNNNSASIPTTSTLTLKNLNVPGYRFLGWYDLPSGSNAEIVKKIEPGEDDIELYAHWEKIEYTVQFKSSLYPIADETYTVDKGVVLPDPKLSNYVFAGWSDEEGHLYDETTIPVGTVGHMTLTANWTSERNKAVTKTKLDDPVIYEDEENKTIYFAYEIGKIENVPLYTIHDFGYISGDGVTRTETKTYSASITESTMQSYAKAVADATTKSANWTLSNGWSNSTSVDQEWCSEKGITTEEATTRGQSSTDTWNISNSSGGSTDTTHLDTTQSDWKNEVKIDSSRETTNTNKLAVGVKNTLTVEAGVEADVPGLGSVSGGIKNEFSASVDVEGTHSKTSKNGVSLGGTDGKAEIETDTTVNSSTWNTSSSYGGSKTSSVSSTTSRAISEMISEKTGYGQQYVKNENWSNSQGFSSTASTSDEYSVSSTYSKVTGETYTSTWTTQATKPGYHRWVVAGTSHVFAVVGYDMAEKSYFVYTYSIMDDETHEFEDYSYTSAAYTDNQNGVISFEVPFEVAEYVVDRTSASAGLKVDQHTGIITEYKGTDNCVVIPEYLNVGGGDVVKVTGIAPTAFAGNTNIVGVILSDFITEIPDNAFAGCSSLYGLLGGDITSIGSRAFSGCSSIVDSGVASKVTYLGENAFEGAERLLVNAANASVAKAAVNSGAKKVVLYLNSLEGGSEALSKTDLTVPDGTEYFEMNGYGKTYNDLTIVSPAGKTVINKTNFVSTGAVPLIISSSEVVLNQVSVQSPGLSLILSAEQTNLGLQDTINVRTVLSKSVNLYESNASVVGKLAVADQMAVCGAIEGIELLDCDDIRYISNADTFNQLAQPHTLHFDANGGTVSSGEAADRTFTYRQVIGELPTPTRTYYSFLGWFTAASGGEQVTAATKLTEPQNVTLYAHWSLNSFTVTFNANGGTVNKNSMTALYGSPLGTLPTPTRDYYTFAGWYTAASGGTQVTSSTVISTPGNLTLYAHWDLKPASGWVLESDVPSGAVVLNEKWTYKKRTNTESKSSSLAGYTQYGSYWVESGRGDCPYASFPSGFSTSHWIYNDLAKGIPYSAYETATSKRVVNNYWEGFVYYHWAINAAYYNNTGRAISSCYLANGQGGYCYGYFYAFTSATTYPYLDNLYCNNQNLPSYNCADQFGSYVGQNISGLYTPRFFRFDYYRSYYIDYYKMFKYYKIESKESSTKVTATDLITNVQRWVQYRAK